MDQRNVVIARDDIPKSGQPLFDSLDLHGVREAVSDVLQLLVCRVVGNQ